MSIKLLDLEKSKKSQNKTQKYKLIDCQEKVDINIDTTNWIKLKDIIKFNKDLRIFNALLNNSYDIVVKIGIASTIKKEYDISQLLLDIKGFIIYLCYFNCYNKINNIIENSSICTKEGDNINILLMKEYKLGNIKFFNWNKDNFYILKSLIKQIFISLFLAFQKYGFLHNDTHFGNFLIRENKKTQIIYNSDIIIESLGYSVIIMDFENSLFDETKMIGYDILYQNYQQIINNILWELNIITNKEELISYIDENIAILRKSENKSIIDIQKLIYLIDELIMLDKRDLTKFTKYNPII